MIPPLDQATEGRVNPKGIPCLYLATDPETAMSEVRPWIGSYLTVAQFRTLENLQVVDCCADLRRQLVCVCADAQEHAAWSEINDAFSRPVVPTDTVADYAPTQVLTEAFRYKGYDGIRYRSAFGKGLNIAIFNPTVAEVGKRSVFDVSSVRWPPELRQTVKTLLAGR